MADYCEKNTIYQTLYSKLYDEVRRTTGERRDFCFEIIGKLKSWCDDIITADVVEVVQCKDCRFYDESDHLCTLYDIKHHNNFYCADGGKTDG